MKDVYFQRLYNPCSVPLGEYRRFKIKVEAAADEVPDTDIDWDLPPNVTLRPGLSGGRIVELTAEAASTNTVTVNIADFAGPPPQISFAGHTPTNIPVRFMIVKNNLDVPATTPQNCENLVWNANRILDQVGITLVLESIAYTNRQDWYETNHTNTTVQVQLVSSLPTADGFEVYAISRFVDDNYDTAGALGLNFADMGSIITEGTSARVLTHEIMHQCGLDDIYVGHDETQLSIPPLLELAASRLPLDWTGTGNYYGRYVFQPALVQRLLMCQGDDPANGDIPLGRVYGLYYTWDPYIGKTWHMGLAEVGLEGMDPTIRFHQ